jgi:hypothetical protein
MRIPKEEAAVIETTVKEAIVKKATVIEPAE